MSCKEKNNCDVIEEIKCRGKDKPINIPFVLPPGLQDHKAQQVIPLRLQ